MQILKLVSITLTKDVLQIGVINSFVRFIKGKNLTLHSLSVGNGSLYVVS